MFRFLTFSTHVRMYVLSKYKSTQHTLVKTTRIVRISLFRNSEVNLNVFVEGEKILIG
jgi:hypothetical protein